MRANLIHFSSAGTVVVESRDQKPGGSLGGQFKPSGLWVSDENDHGWSAWCADESYGRGQHAYTVNLTPAAKILKITTPEELVEFDRQFRSADAYYVDWQSVAAHWQGVIISPYQWSLRLSDVRWYYSWDCASGCIWDAAAIAGLTLVPDWDDTHLATVR